MNGYVKYWYEIGASQEEVLEISEYYLRGREIFWGQQLKPGIFSPFNPVKEKFNLNNNGPIKIK